MEQIIKSVQKGYGEGDIFYTTDTRVAKQYVVDAIRAGDKQVSNDMIINVYRGYKDGKLVFEMGASIDVTVTYQ